MEYEKMTDTTANEKIEQIANRCLELLEERLKNLKVEDQYDAAREVRAAGEALKALAEGIKSYKEATKVIKMDFKSP